MQRSFQPPSALFSPGKQGADFSGRSKDYLVEVDVAGVEMALLLEEVSLVPVGQLQSSRQVFLHISLLFNSLPQTVKLQGQRGHLQ